MAVIIDELMFPEPANIRSLFFWSLYGIIVNSRMAAFILEPVQFERQGLRACMVSHWLMRGPVQVWRVTDHILVCDLAASCQSASSEIWSMLSCFTHPFFGDWSPIATGAKVMSPMGAVAEAAGQFDIF